MTRAGLPHSGISGSSAACASPKRFVAGYALRRLLVPRHPPYALTVLDHAKEILDETLPTLYAVFKVPRTRQSSDGGFLRKKTPVNPLTGRWSRADSHRRPSR